MNDLVLQSGAPSSSGVENPSFAMLMMVIIPALMIISGTVMGCRALRNIRVAGGALGAPVLATFAAGLVPAIVIVIICGGGLVMLAEEVVRGPRSRSDVWGVAGGAVGAWLSFLMMRGMYRSAIGWSRPARGAAESAHSAMATAAIVFTIVGSAILLVILTASPERLFPLFPQRNWLVFLDLAVLLGGLICGVLGRLETAAKVCAWICGSLFVFLLLTVAV